MNENSVFRNNKILIGLIVIAVIVCVYSYNTKSGNPVKTEELKRVAGTLKTKPSLGEDGGDMPTEYIIIEFNEFEHKFFLKNCAFDMCKKDEILDLKEGVFLEFYIKSEQQNIFNLSVNNSRLLKIEDFNKCYTNKWRYLIPITIIMMLILVYRVFIESQLFIKLKSKYLFKSKN